MDNNTKIEGNIRLWTHGTLPTPLQSSPFYGSYTYNYTPGDYLTYNFTGTSCCPAAPSDLFIGAGQGFFVQMIDGPAVNSSDNVTISFNNNLRNASYSNNSFYKTSNQAYLNVNTIERNRIWLDLINPNGATDRTLLGYIENATMNQDSFYDCATQNMGGTMIYSLIGDTKFSIQGRALPFDENDEVPIGFNIPSQGNYTIAIGALDGLFESNTQNIYLEDTYLNVVQNLKLNPYTFTSTAGNFNDRFKLRYTNNSLSNSSNASENSFALISNNTIKIASSEDIKEIAIYDVSGKLIKKYNFETAKQSFEDYFPYAKGFYVTTIKFKNDTSISKKLLH